MSEVTGRVSEVYSYNTKVGTMYGLVVDGQKYGCGKTQPRAAEGDNVSFRYTANGNYKNIDMKTFSVTAGPPAAKSGGLTVNKGESFGDRQNSIVRQNAVSSAVAWMGVLAAAEAIPGIGKTTKTEDRFNILTAMLAETADDFFNANIKGVSLGDGSTPAAGEDTGGDSGWE